MKVFNKRAKFDYEIKETLEVGVVLSGPEVKSTKMGQISLREAFVKPIGEELFLVNAHISAYKPAAEREYNPTRARKLLLHRREIAHWQHEILLGKLTIVPIACYTKKGKIKLEIGLGKGRKQFEKREVKKKADLAREAERDLADWKQ